MEREGDQVLPPQPDLSTVGQQINVEKAEGLAGLNSLIWITLDYFADPGACWSGRSVSEDMARIMTNGSINGFINLYLCCLCVPAF